MKGISILRTMVIILIVSLIAAGQGFAGNTAKPNEKKVRDVLKESVKYPQHLVKSGATGKVEVIFTISEKGEIVVKNLKSTNPDLEAYVREQLENTCCKELKTNFNQHFKVTFSFNIA
jgi:outer membrane biosynthesis protein TonB